MSGTFQKCVCYVNALLGRFRSKAKPLAVFQEHAKAAAERSEACSRNDSVTNETQAPVTPAAEHRGPHVPKRTLTVFRMFFWDGGAWGLVLAPPELTAVEVIERAGPFIQAHPEVAYAVRECETYLH